MSKLAWAIIIGVVVLLILAVGATLFLPFVARNLGLGLGFARPGLLGGFGLGFLVLRGLGSLLFWVLLIAGIFLLFRTVTVSPSTSGTAVVASETPLDILKRRYANGEISKEQYEEMNSTLGG